MENIRELKGQEIASHEGAVKRLSENEYEVHSQSREFTVYSVRRMSTGWTCSCPDYQTRGVRCKHIFAVQFSQQIREEVRKNVIIEPVEINGCIFCHSPKVKKNGHRLGMQLP